MDLATHSSRSNTVGFLFSSRASSRPFGWITRRIINLLTFILRSVNAEQYDFGGKITPALEPFQKKVSSLVLLL